jgi:hypothetical protein
MVFWHRLRRVCFCLFALGCGQPRLRPKNRRNESGGYFDRGLHRLPTRTLRRNLGQSLFYPLLMRPTRCQNAAKFSLGGLTPSPVASLRPLGTDLSVAVARCSRGWWDLALMTRRTRTGTVTTASAPWTPSHRFTRSSSAAVRRAGLARATFRTAAAPREALRCPRSETGVGAEVVPVVHGRERRGTRGRRRRQGSQLVCRYDSSNTLIATFVTAQEWLAKNDITSKRSTLT